MVYTLIFVLTENKILLINREKSPWKGCWNGLGGKIEANETVVESTIRELKEETGLDVLEKNVIYKGKLTWNTSSDYLHIFICYTDTLIKTPVKTREGILDYKSLDWIMGHNLGVAHNIPFFIESVLFEEDIYDYHCIFDEDTLLDVTKEKVIK